jgi:ABC-type uncharacterized transport system YnjBCD ATPase subunit/GNAT superfamily N-acetyltransferase
MNTIITLTSPVHETPRVEQVRGLFDLTEQKTCTLTLPVVLPLEGDWQIGLITGPSGCGKSTVARHIWPDLVWGPHEMQSGWHADKALVDEFPDEAPVKEVTELLSSVGFSSPPAWLRPYHTLSTGEQFRAAVAVLLCNAIHKKPPVVVIDEFTSVIDRTVARIGSAAIARTVRAKGIRFVAVTCHDDVIDWLQPDWVYRPAESRFTRRLLQRRPPITLDIKRCSADVWPLFAPHHYLSETHNRSAVCFLATWAGRPVCFSSWLPFVGIGARSRREHRTVTLPDFQGVGIGNHVSATIASMWKALGYVPRSTTTHPSMIASRQRSPLWRMSRPPALARSGDGPMNHATTRLTAGFEYIGPPMNGRLAKALLGK